MHCVPVQLTCPAHESEPVQPRLQSVELEQSTAPLQARMAHARSQRVAVQARSPVQESLPAQPTSQSAEEQLTASHESAPVHTTPQRSAASHESAPSSHARVPHATSHSRAATQDTVS